MSQTELFPKSSLELRLEDQNITCVHMEEAVDRARKSVDSAEEKLEQCRLDAAAARRVLEYLRQEHRLESASTAVAEEPAESEPEQGEIVDEGQDDGPSDYELAREYGDMVSAASEVDAVDDGMVERLNVLAEALEARGIDPIDWQAVVTAGPPAVEGEDGILGEHEEGLGDLAEPDDDLDEPEDDEPWEYEAPEGRPAA